MAKKTDESFKEANSDRTRARWNPSEITRYAHVEARTQCYQWIRSRAAQTTVYQTFWMVQFPECDQQRQNTWLDTQAIEGLWP